MTTEALKSYPIKGGETGRARLSVLAGVLAPTTEKLFERAGPLAGLKVIDVGCGGGDVTFALARQVGPKGHVTGIDLDADKLEAARGAARAKGLAHVSFEACDVTKTWPVADAGLVYARFILTHLKDPLTLLKQAMAALKPAGMILVEDIDIAGRVLLSRLHGSGAIDGSLYGSVAAARRRPPYRTAPRPASRSGRFQDAGTTVVQPFSRQGGAKDVMILTLAAIADGLLAEKLVTDEELTRIKEDLEAFAQRPDTIVSMPRIFQAWGRKP